MTKAKAGKPQGWQNEAWILFDRVGELRYLANWIGNVMSRASLHAAKRVGNELIPQTTGPAREAMDALYGGPQGQSQMLQAIGTNLTVAGEGYLWGNGDEWLTFASGGVTQTTRGKMIIHHPDGKRDKAPGDVLIRIWTPHPRDLNLADSPVRSNIGNLTQIVGYDDHIQAQLTSRLAGAGILPMPSEVQFPVPEGADPNDSSAQHLLATLYKTMMAAREDLSGPASLVPIVVTVPGELLDKLPTKPITFWTDLDEAVIDMRDAAIKRFAVGMDAPPEVIMGTQDSNHWNAWLSEESGIKTHLEPRLGVVNHALTGTYLRPSLEGQVPEDELEDYYVIADTSQIRTRPNRVTEALELRDKGLLGDEATLREAGFKAEDRLEGDEYEQWLLQRVSLGAVTPEQTAWALGKLGLAGAPSGEQEPQGPATSRRDTGELPQDRPIPDRKGNEDPLAAACGVLVFRALERAGNRLKNKQPALNGTPLHECHLQATGDPDFLLEGSWTCAPDALADLDTDPMAVIETLDFYVRGLLQMQRPHSQASLRLLLKGWNHDPLPV